VKQQDDVYCKLHTLHCPKIVQNLFCTFYFSDFIKVVVVDTQYR